MIHTNLVIGDEERNIMTELALQNDYLVKRRKNLKPIGIIVGIISLGLGIFFLICADAKLCGIILVLFSIYFFYMAFKGNEQVQKKSLDRTMKGIDDERFKGEREYFIDDTGIKVVSELGNSKILWNGLESYTTIHDYICMVTKDNRVVMFKINELSESEKSELNMYLVNILKK